MLSQQLHGGGLAQDHDEQQPPAAESIQVGEFPRQPHRVAPRHDQVGPEFQPRGACSGVRQADKGIEEAVEHMLGEPERIEPQPFEVIHQLWEGIECQVRLASTRKPEPDFHGPPSTASLW